MRFCKPIGFLCILCLLANFSFGQKKGLKDIQQFLQQNADSTIIFEYTSNWMHPPKYWMISKKKDTITLYKYAAALPPRTLMPKKMRDTLVKLHYRKNSLDVGINTYFNVKYMKTKDLKELWLSLRTQTPWQLKDDKIDGEGCPIAENKNGQQISDGGGIDLHLITKQEIRRLSFYAPDFYHGVCPGRAGRIAILKIEKLFSKVFKEAED